jgi:hypothetical protein
MARHPTGLTAGDLHQFEEFVGSDVADESREKLAKGTGRKRPRPSAGTAMRHPVNTYRIRRMFEFTRRWESATRAHAAREHRRSDT